VFGFVSNTLDLSHDTLVWLAVAAAGVAALSFLLVLIALARLRALGRRVRRLTSRGARADAAGGGPDLTALRHVGVVRYDAFGDMGGRLSFSAAVFDSLGNGFVLSSINGRSETRTYAKLLSGLKSEQTLSPEEQQAIREAQSDDEH
jgi:heme exporter protein D